MPRSSSIVGAGIAILLCAPAAAGQDPVRERIQSGFSVVEAAVRARGVTATVVADFETTLEEGHSEDVAMTFVAGRSYGVQAFCDADCTDLDLTLVDPQGRTVTASTLDGAAPVLAADVTATGEYTLGIDMVGCEIEPCLARVRIYQLR